jgi:hypothetical protein
MKRLKPFALFCSDVDDKYCVCVCVCTRVRVRVPSYYGHCVWLYVCMYSYCKEFYAYIQCIHTPKNIIHTYNVFILQRILYTCYVFKIPRILCNKYMMERERALAACLERERERERICVCV